MKSFSLVRTQPRLTTNVKILVDSKYSLYLESIESVPELNGTRFKKFLFNKDHWYDELLPYFFKGLPADIAFSVKNEDPSNMSKDFANQYDEIYQFGARNIENNKNYSEEFEFFAPFYFRGHLPKSFIVFRIDGPGLTNLNRLNFKSEFLSKMKVVKVFDLQKTSPLGEWLERNFITNSNFPKTPLELDFQSLEFSKWSGIDYETGGYTTKSEFMDQKWEEENSIFDLERSITDGYLSKKVIFPNIINMGYLFDDTPATPTSLRKWSINRYSGFYLEDLEKIDTISPFTTPDLRKDIVIESGNLLRSLEFGDPFLLGFDESKPMYIEYLGNFYKVEKFVETLSSGIAPVSQSSTLRTDTPTIPQVNRYRIIADIDLTGQHHRLNDRLCYINSKNQIVRQIDNNPFIIDDFDMADLNIILIDGKYHSVIKEGDYLKVYTDYAFEWSENTSFSYYINKGDSNYLTSFSLKELDSSKNFQIFRCKLMDICDFDTHLSDNDYSKFEYDKVNDLSKTEETKMMVTDLRSTSNPAVLDDFKFKNEISYIPTASDYTGNLETFQIDGKRLNDLWRKNTLHCRWGYQGSNSVADRPYLLNNNDIHGPYNRTVNTKLMIPNRRERNLDYFYSINSGSSSYVHHSLHIERNSGGIQDLEFDFELDKYLGIATYSLNDKVYPYDFDYFSLFFDQSQEFLNSDIIKHQKKYSILSGGDVSVPPNTVFKGIKFKAYDVSNLIQDSTVVVSANLATSNRLDGYKFSILFGQNNYMPSSTGLYSPYIWGTYTKFQDNGGTMSIYTSDTATPSNVNIGDRVELIGLTPSFVTYVGALNLGGYGIVLDKPHQVRDYSGTYKINMDWDVIDNWQIEKSYKAGELVIYQDIIYRTILDNTVTVPGKNPSNLPYYVLYTDNNIMWYPGTTASYVYNSGDYYQIGSGSVDFWNPGYTYSVDDKVIYDGKYYISLTASNIDNNPVNDIDDSDIEWKEVEISNNQLKWIKISLWDSNITYLIGTYIILDDVLYQSTSSTKGDNPSISNKWDRLYSMVPDTNFGYTPTNNPIIQINNYYYRNTFNTVTKPLTLDSGIVVYINHKWKNVLVNISINDNTLDATYMRNCERDKLYTSFNGRITASNFIRQINDLDSKYGMADFTSYVIIKEDGSWTYHKFNQGLNTLSSLIMAEEADEFNVRNQSLTYQGISVDKNILKPARFLVDGNLDKLTKLNYYNELPLAVSVTSNKEESQVLPNFSGNISSNSTKFYRFSGIYEPIFYPIDLFKSPDIFEYEDCDRDFKFNNGLSSDWVVKKVVINQTYLYGSQSVIGTYSPSTWDSFVGSTWSFGENKTLKYIKVDGFSQSIQWSEEYGSTPVVYPFNTERVPTIKDLYSSVNGDHLSMDFITPLNPELMVYTIQDCSNFILQIATASNNQTVDFYFQGKETYKRKNRIGNYKFDTSLTYFGILKQRIISKINRKENILKLRNNNNYPSIYPQVDEVGYHVVDSFIFKGSWDFEYHWETQNPVSDNPLPTTIWDEIQQKYNL
jgi:hypothetical protein